MPHWIGIIGTGLIMLAFIPQILHVLKIRRAGGLSIKANVLNVLACLVLFIYSLQRNELIFIIVMGYQLTASIAILTLNIVYQDGTT